MLRLCHGGEKKGSLLDMQICGREHAFHFHEHSATAHRRDLTVRLFRRIHITEAESINITSEISVQGVHLKQGAVTDTSGPYLYTVSSKDKTGDILC